MKKIICITALSFLLVGCGNNAYERRSFIAPPKTPEKKTNTNLENPPHDIIQVTEDGNIIDPLEQLYLKNPEIFQ